MYFLCNPPAFSPYFWISIHHIECPEGRNKPIIQQTPIQTETFLNFVWILAADFNWVAHIFKRVKRAFLAQSPGNQTSKIFCSPDFFFFASPASFCLLQKEFYKERVRWALGRRAVARISKASLQPANRERKGKRQWYDMSLPMTNPATPDPTITHQR